MELQVMTMDHYEGVLDLWQRCDGVAVSEADSREGIEQYLARNPDSCFVAIECDRIVGAILCGHDGRRGLLHHLAVDGAHRGKGIGRALVGRCIERLRSHGIPKCYILVFTKNRAGREFWQALGWSEFSERAVVLAKETG